MNGSWLGRGRGGRLAIYAGCVLVLIFIMLLYRAVSLEISWLRKKNELCTNQQEALASQLQVIYDYKIRLEKFLADEKSSNAAVKQELQQRASREKSLRDKDTIEAMQRFNALQQTYKLLQTENQDLEEELKNFKIKMSEESKKYIAQIQQFKDQIKAAEEDKKNSMEHLKTKYMELESEKTALENKLSNFIKTSGDTGSNMEHLRKEIIQLKRELDQTKKHSREGVASPAATSRSEKMVIDKKSESVSVNQQEEQEQLPQPSPSNQLQVSSTASKANIASPLETPLQQKEKPNDVIEDVAFVMKDNLIVPADPRNIDVTAPVLKKSLTSSANIDKLTQSLVSTNSNELKMIPNILSVNTTDKSLKLHNSNIGKLIMPANI